MELRSATASPKAGSTLTASRSAVVARRESAARCACRFAVYRAAVDVYRRLGGGQVVIVAGILVTPQLHDCKIARVS
jgi:hypothetical protein